MKFDPYVLTRLVDGDPTAGTEPIEFDDGTVKPLSECTASDLQVMNLWMKYKHDEAVIRLAELPPRLRVVN